MQGTSKITPSKLVLREKLFGSELTAQLILQSASTFFRDAHVTFQQPTMALLARSDPHGFLFETTAR
jgi:hypothetical protein